MKHRNTRNLSQSQIDAAVEYGSNKPHLRRSADRRAFAWLRAQVATQAADTDLEDPERVLQRFNMPGALR